MNILNVLTIKNLKLNIKRTIVTIIGITLSVALICAITTFVSSFQNSIIDRTKNVNGDYHIDIKYLNKDDSKYILNNLEFEKKYVYQDVGYSLINNYKNEYKPYIFLQAFDVNGIQNMGLKLLDGRFPKNSNEVVIPEHMIKYEGINYKIGDKLELNLGKRILLTGEELNQNNPITVDEKDETTILEKITQINKKEVTIVGVIERPEIENYSAPGYTFITILDDNIKNENSKINVAALLKNPQNTYKFGNRIMGEYYMEYQNNQSELPSITYNDELLRFEGVGKSDSIMSTLLIMAIIVICIIMFTSVFVIKNSFSISITERLKQYGMLSSVGATSKQIKRNIRFEALILGLISIPLGVLIGVVSIWIVLIFVSELLTNANLLPGLELKLSVSYIAILVAVIVSSVTIYISTILPARKASKISAISAIRENEDIKITGKKLKTSKLFNKIFGIEGEIASKNLKRSKSKYRTTVFSIFISIILFISISSFIDYGFKINGLYYEKTENNINIFDNSSVNKKVPEFFKNICNLNNIEKYTILKSDTVSTDINKYVTEEMRKNFEADNVEEIDIRLIALGDSEYRRYIQKLGLKYDDIKDEVILLDKITVFNNEKRKEGNVLNVKNGDKINIFRTINDKKEEHEIKIALKAEEVPLGVSKNLSNQVTMIVSDEMIENFDYRCNNMYIKSNDPYKLEEDIIKLDKTKQKYVYNLEEQSKEENSMVIIVSIFLYGFITVISIIGVTNIFNTITTNMALREREFAILKSIGMTNKEFRKMINYESILYGLKALLFGIPVGVAISYLIYIVMSNSYETAFMIPFGAILICIIFVFITVFCTMRYSFNKTKNKNIIDIIRKENI